MFELLNSIIECIEYVSRNVTSNLSEIVETWGKCSKLYAGVLDKTNVAWRANLDIDLLEEFPDIRSKLAKKLEMIESEQLSFLHLVDVRLLTMNECLKFKLDKINEKIEQMSFEEYKELKHAISEHVMWIDDCWRCLHCFYMQLHFSLISLDVSNEETTLDLINAIKQSDIDKLTIGKSQVYLQSCLGLLKFVENKSKVKFST